MNTHKPIEPPLMMAWLIWGLGALFYVFAEQFCLLLNFVELFCGLEKR